MKAPINTMCSGANPFSLLLVLFVLFLNHTMSGFDPGLKEIYAGGGPPTISSFTPICATPGTVVTINGANFGGISAVKINGVNATSFTFVSATQVTAVVSATATTGAISVTATSGTGTSSTNLSVVNYTISSFSPSSGAVGTSVTLTGTNLSAITAVKFNGVAATYTINSSTQITTTVPSGATTGTISVTGSCGNGFSTGSFTVISGSITSVSPSCGLSGTSVTITGTNFTGATGVKFNGVSATYTVNSATQITTTVPSGATGGPVSVITSAGNPITSATNFSIPGIVSFSPFAATTGSTVVITGEGFTGATGVTFNGITAASTVTSSTQITTTVPAGSASGTIAVTTPCGSVSIPGFVLIQECASNVQYIYTSSEGSTGTAKGQYNQPSAIAIGALGQKYIADGQNHRVQCGTITWGSLGTADGQFNYPSGLALAADGRVYVADGNNNRIQIFDMYGTFLGKWGTTGTASSQFNSPAGVAIDNYGNVYVCDKNNHRVQKFSSTGTFISQLGTGIAGNANGQFNTPVGVAIDNAGNIFVTDKDNHRIQKFNSSGVYQTQWFCDMPWAIAVDASNNVYVSDVQTHLVIKSTNNGVYLTQVGDFGVAGSINNPTGIAIDQSCNMFVIDYNNAVQLYTPFSPPVISSFAPACGISGTQVIITGTGFNTATAVKFGGVNANSFVVNSATQITALVSAGANTGPVSITTVGGTGYSSTNFTMSKVSSFTPACGIEGTTVIITGSNFTGATGVNFNGTPAIGHTVNSNTQITATVPVGATPGPVSVVTVCGTAVGGTFTVLKLNETFTPSCGTIGTSVTITGTGFAGTTDVTFNGVSAIFDINSATQITAIIPSGATTGKIAITNPCGSLTSIADYPVSMVASLSPSCGVSGTTVTITGSNFTNATAVSFTGPPWVAKTTGFSGGLIDVDFVDPSTGFICGSGGTVLRTVDGGATFSSLSTGTTSSLYAVDFIDSQHGFVAGDAGAILETFNGGLTWSPANISTSGNQRLIEFVNPTTGYLSGSAGIFKTVNAGASWTNIYNNTGSLAYSLQFVNSSVGYMSGYLSNVNQAMFKKTIDGGATWTNVNAGSGNSIVRLSFLDQNTGLICETSPTVSKAVIKKTTDGGATWTTVYTAATNGYTKIIFVNATTAFCVGGNGTSNTSSLLRSDDAGTTWTPVSISSSRLVSMCEVNGSTFYVSGLNGTLLKGVMAPASFTVINDNQISAITPSDAVSGPISISSTCGNISTLNYTVSRITSFSPACGTIGNSVTITGTGFAGTTDVTFNGVSAIFDINSATQITAIIPAGATTGKISITNPCGSLTSIADYPVSMVASISPSCGVPGTTVTIAGSNFTNATAVKFNGVSASSFVVNNDGEISAVIPSNALSGPIGITTSCGEVFSSPYVTTNIASFTPSCGTIGTSVTITGSGFTGTTDVKFNGVSAVVTINSVTEITAVIPAGATSGLISITSPCGVLSSASNFKVSEFTSFSPASGDPGTTVTLIGQNFQDASSVSFNGTPASMIEKNSNSQITAIVPMGATTGAISVVYDGCTTLASTSPFQVFQQFCTASVSQTYSYKSQWGGLGGLPGKFNNPTGIAIDKAGNIFVADINNHRIQKFNSNGGFIKEWGVQGSGDGQFFYPWGVAVDYLGDVYVADRTNCRVQKFDNQGTFITKWGHPGNGDDEFASPTSIATDPLGYVYVLDYSNGRIQKFSNTGAFIRLWSVSGNVLGIAIDATGNVYTANYDDDVIRKYTSNGVYSGQQWVCQDARAIALDNMNNMYVTVMVPSGGGPSSTTTVIKKLSSSGVLLSQWGSNGNGDGEFIGGSVALAIDQTCNLFVADHGNSRIQVFEPNNAPRFTITSPTSTSSWRSRESRTITWTSSNIESTAPVKIEIFDGTDWTTITTTATNTGSYTITELPLVAAAITNSQIRVSLLSHPAIQKTSSSFVLDPPSITVTAPGPGEIWTSGGTATVTWTSLGLLPGEGVSLYLIDGQQLGHLLTTSADNGTGGSATVTVPNWLVADGHAKIFAHLSFESLISDYSDEFTVAPACAATNLTYPYTEGFETDLGIWQQSTTDDFDWTRQSGGTPLSWCGPDAAHSGSYYMYTDGRAPNSPWKAAVLYTSCFDFSPLTSPELRFWYHMYGFGMGTMQVEVSADRGGNWSEAVWTMEGDQGNVWRQAIIDLSAYQNKIVQIRIIGATRWVHSSDMAIDDIWLGEKPNPCAAVISTFPHVESFEGGLNDWVQSTNDDAQWSLGTGATPNAFTGPDNGQDGASYIYIPSDIPLVNIKTAGILSPCFDLTDVRYPELRFWYHMLGSSMGEMELQISTDGGANWETEPIWTKSGDQGNAWHETVIDLTPYKTRSFKFRFVGTTASISQNDMAIDHVTVQNANPCNGISYNTFPYQESFEGAMTGWVQSVDDDKNWSNNDQPSIHPFTGPGTMLDGSHYMYLECFDPYNAGLSAVWSSPCFDLTTLLTPTVSFHYNMYGPDNGIDRMGTLDFQVSDNNGTTWKSLWTKTGDQGNSWHEAIVDVSDYVNNSVRFRFIGTTGGTSRSDMAIDKFVIANKSIAVTQPVSSSIWDAESTQTVTWQTFGILPSDFVSIELYDGTVWQMLAESTLNDGSESVVIPDALVTYTSQIRITLLQDPPIPPALPKPVTSAVSINFTVNVPESITIVDPVAGVDWVTGFSHIVNWTSEGLLATEPITISYFDGITWIPLVTTTNDGTEVVTIPFSATTITNAQIKITVISEVNIFGISDEFILSSPAIMVTSPIVGSSVTANSNLTVNWTSNIPANENVTIDLYDGVSSTTLAVTGNDDGTQTVTIPEYCSVVNNAQIKVSSVSNNTIYGANNITINPKQTLTLTSPIATTVWTAGSTKNVTWNNCGVPTSQSISVDFYNGSSWTNGIASGTNGSVSITVPSVSSNISNAKIKISYTTGAGTVSSISDNFTVNAPYCSGTTALTGTSGTITDGIITDGSGTGNYQNNMNCSWTVTLPGGKDFFFKPTVNGLDGNTIPYGGTRNYFNADLATFNYMTTQGDYLLVKRTYPSRPGSSGYTEYGIYSNPTHSQTFVDVLNGIYTTSTGGDAFTSVAIEISFHSDNATVAAGWSLQWAIRNYAYPPVSPFRIDDEVIYSDDTQLDFSVYPNPAQDKIMIAPTIALDGNYQVTVLNSLGEMVLRPTESNSKELDLSALTEGIYTVKIEMNNKVFTKKIVHIK